jgi:hypothetical protein
LTVFNWEAIRVNLFVVVAEVTFVVLGN